MRCKECKYFNRYPEGYAYTVGYGSCGHHKMVDDLYVTPAKDSNMPLDGVYATCDEGRGELQVGEEFGCIHFEQK